jgi:GTP-binding protein
MSSIERCDVALLVLDTSQKVSHQDQQIAHYIVEQGKGVVILANKWDIGQGEAEEQKRRAKYIGQLKHRFPFLAWAPVVFTSAVTKKNLNPIFEQIELALSERKKRIPTAKLNQWVEKWVIQHPPTGKTRTKPKIYYLTQAQVSPPHFILFVNKTAAFHFSYLRYLENRLREEFGFLGTAIKLEYREKEREEKRRKT